MVNDIVRQEDFSGAEIVDLDQIAAEADRLRTVYGTTELKGNRGLRFWLEPVGKVIRPSFDGKIKANGQTLFDDGREMFRCGR